MKAREATRCLLLAASLGPAAEVAGQETKNDDPDHGVVFIYPTADQVYNLMDTVNVTYTSPFLTPNLYTFCKNTDQAIIEVFKQRVPGNATVPIILDVSTAKVNFTVATECWFNLRPGTEPGFGANSKRFTLIGQERGSGSKVFGPPSETETGPETPTTSDGGTNPTASETGGGSSDTSTGQAPPPVEAESSSLSAGASAGIGVGVAVGVLALAGGVFFWWRRRRSQARSQAIAVNGGGGGGEGDGGEMGPQHFDDKRYVSNLEPEAQLGSGPSPPQELGPSNGPVELGSSTPTMEGTHTKQPKYEMAA